MIDDNFVEFHKAYNMAVDMYRKGKAAGITAEHERIIKLFETKHLVTDDGYHLIACFGCTAIALIKGETK